MSNEQLRIALHPAAARPVQEPAPGVVLRPGLAFGAHYDPARTSCGALVAHNRDTLAPGAAYGAHSHRDTEILTLVLSGTLVHVDGDGAASAVPAGAVQYLDTGTGWHHDERAGDGEPAEVVQMWLAPDLEDPPPGPPRRVVGTVPDVGDVVLAGGHGDGGLVALRRAGVRVDLLRVGSGEPRSLPAASGRHVYVLGGAVSVGPGAHAADGPAGAVPVAGESVVGESVVGDPVVGESGDVIEIRAGGPVLLHAGDEGAEVVVVGTA